MMKKLPHVIGMMLMIILSTQFVFSQHTHHEQRHEGQDQLTLEDMFKKYSILTEDLEDEVLFLKKNDDLEMPIDYNGQQYTLYLYKNNLITNSYKSRTASGRSNDNLAIPTNGFTQKGDIASITIARDFLFGYFEDSDGGKIYVEPLRFYMKGAEHNKFVIFHEEDILIEAEGVCGTTEKHDLRQKLESSYDQDQAEMIVNACLEVELAIASDFSMYQAYGNSISALENRNIGVINDVQTNYIDDFSDTIQFNIVEQFISDCATCDPWTNSTDAGVLLSSFTSWGPTGFTATHDMGELWTHRDLDGGTVGIAWLGAVCTSNRYHVGEDFTSNSNLMRVMIAHEMGHNFDATHDAAGSPFIMAPAVQNTNTWSSASISDINSFVSIIDPPGGCLSNCPASASPVVADFGSTIQNICQGADVQFFEKASGPVATYSWSFPGGIPSTSTQPNPVVAYPAGGSYSVTLTVTNGGTDTDSKTINGMINVGFGGSTVFAFEDFEDGSTGQWTPGGGQSWSITSESGVQYGSNTFKVNNFSSGGQVDLESPVLDLLGYANATLELNYSYATRGGNSDSLVAYVSTDGGATFTHVWGIEENGSGNYATAPGTNSNFAPQDADEWCHGTGNTCLSIPLAGAGNSQNVVIRLRNKAFGGNNLYIDYMYISSDCYNLNPPIADFTSNVQQGCNDLAVEFQDLSLENPISWNWSFPGGDPASSTEQNPSVYYDQPGVYSVQLTVSNPEGSDTETKTDYIFIEGDPNALFTYSVNGREVTFTNQSMDAFNFAWNFGDGNSSTDENPVHTYNQDGNFTVQLTASNNCGADTYSETITIATPPIASFSASDSVICENENIIFDANGSQNTTAYYWEFPGGDPAFSSEVVESVTYDSAGTYDVIFVASNPNGDDTIHLTNYVTVNPLPESDFLFTEIDLTVEFFNNSADYDSLRWLFGDGNQSINENPIHTYANEGTYDVSLLTFNSCGTDTFTTTIMVEEAVNASFIANNNSGCLPLEIEFDGSGSNGATSFAWTFEGGNPMNSSMMSPTVVYDAEGTFDVTLIVSDGLDTDTMLMEDFITVLDGPTGTFDFSVDQREVTFTSNISGFNSLNWSFGDGNSSSVENPVHEYDTDGVYNVTLTLMNECDTLDIDQQVTIATPPTADFSFNISEGCIPLEVTFSNNSTENTNAFAWTFEGGNPGTSTMENPVVTYDMSGEYDVQLIAYSNGGTDTINMPNAITVFPDPDPDFDFTVDTTTVVFTNNSMEANSYVWDFGDGDSSTIENPTHTYSTEGSYTVTLTAMNDCDTISFSREIGTASLPQANFSVQGDTEGCEPFTVQFMNQSMGTIDSYSWTFEGGSPNTSNEENPVVTYSSPGTYNVSLIVTNAAGDNELVRNDYIDVIAQASGDVDISIVDSLTVEFSGSVMGDPPFNVNWEFGDGNGSSQEDVVYTYQNAGTYDVMFIVTNECGSDTTFAEITVGSTSAVQEILKEIRIYPNPTQSLFTVDRLPVGAQMKIVDQYGKQIMDQEVRSSVIKVNSSGWAAGVYYLNVIYENDRHIYKVIIQ